MSLLIPDTDAAGISGPLAELLSHLKNHELAEQRQIDLNRAIATVELELDGIATTLTNNDHLLKRREDMLADRAIGAATQADVDALDEEIQHAEQALAERNHTAAARITELTQSLRGLKRKSDDAATEIALLCAVGKDLMFDAIKAEMEAACGEYVAAALAVRDQFLRLVALERISMSLRHNGVGAILPNADMQLPLVRLPPCRGIANPWNESRGVLFANDSLFTKHVARAIDIERERMVSAGLQRYLV
jgi:hypothetical protein